MSFSDQFLIWGQKVNEPGVEITSSVWEVVFNTNLVVGLDK